MTTETAPRGLHVKLAEVMAEAERIPKRGIAPAAMGGFPFVQVGDAADAIRAALGARGVSMLPSAIEMIGEAEHATSSGKTMTTLTVRTTWTLVDGETGQSAVIQSIGAGADMGDKAAPKAQTSAMKYALLMGFLLSTGDDVEQSDTSDRQRRTPTGKRPAVNEPEDNEPILVSLGTESHEGKVTKGDGQSNDCVYHAHPDGYRFGFRLAMADGKGLPQVVCNGAIGLGLYGLIGDDIVGQTVKVTGEAFRVETRGRRPYRRLVVSAIEGDGWRVPMPEPEAGASVAPGAAPSDLDDLPW